MSSFSVYFPVRIVFGEGELANLGSQTKSLGNRAFLIADPYLATIGLTDRISVLLDSQGIHTTVFTAVNPNPEVEDIDKLGQMLRAAQSQFVIGVGGGSAVDTAKAASVAATHEGSIDSYVNWHASPKPVTNRILPIVAIPTTSGTGAEATPVAVLANPVTLRKTAVVSEQLYPRLALVDPELSATMPPSLTAATGIDALSHAIEAILCTTRRNSFSDIVAFEAVSLVSQYLPKAYADGGAMEARGKMAWAATLGGMSIALSGTTTPHALAQPLGVRTNMHHGLTIAIFLPSILERSWQADPPLFAQLSTALGVPATGLSVGARARSVGNAVRALMTSVGLDREIARLSIDQATADAIVQDGQTYLGHLIKRHVQPFTEADLMEIVKESITVH